MSKSTNAVIALVLLSVLVVTTFSFLSVQLNKVTVEFKNATDRQLNIEVFQAGSAIRHRLVITVEPRESQIIDLRIRIPESSLVVINDNLGGRRSFWRPAAKLGLNQKESYTISDSFFSDTNSSAVLNNPSFTTP